MTNPTDAEIVRKGVRLAKGWYWSSKHHSAIAPTGEYFFGKILADTLAAQLARQVLQAGHDVEINVQGSTYDAPGIFIAITKMDLSETLKFECGYEGDVSIPLIRAIVESGVLEGAGE